MIAGVGTDIIEIARIEKAFSNKRLAERIYTPQELAAYRARGGNVAFLAGNFSAKEAVAKALGTGFAGFSPFDVEILRDENGRPFVTLYGRAREKAEALGVGAIHISISNTAAHAVAFAVAERQPANSTVPIKPV